MAHLPLSKLGAIHHSKHPFLVEFGVFLPEIADTDGYQLFVKVIHEEDQFLQAIQPHQFELSCESPHNGSSYEYWSGKVNLKDHKKFDSSSSWGNTGKYLYRYCLKHPNIPDEIDWIIDPFAREFGIGKLSAFTIGEDKYKWSPNELEWKTPALNDLIIYEMMISEFGQNIQETTNRLDYLADLGVNCLNIMPISNIVNTIDWGYKPIGYFGVDERFGSGIDLKQLIDAAHQRGIAVILDVVYAHTEEHFAYCYLYRKLGKNNPVMGNFAQDGFGQIDECTDFNNPFIQQFFLTVNCYLLEEYHVDGFRYDFVPGYWDGAMGNGYANLTYQTYQEVKSQAQRVQKKDKGWKKWQRFFTGSSNINLVQCAEQLQDPKGILHKSYSNCTWQNQTLYTSKQVAHGHKDYLYNLALSYSLYGYPNQVINEDDTQTKTALQYIETHDHKRFVCNWGLKPTRNEHLLKQGDRDQNWFKVQPYLIGVLTAKGIPLIWQGQEFAENYFLPSEGAIRVMLFRPIRWEYFYDEIGKKMIRLVRKLIRLRRQQPQFRSLNDDSYYFDNHYDRYQSRGILILYRKLENNLSLIALNFSDQEQTINFRFPDDPNFQLPSNYSGNFTEELDGKDFDLKQMWKDQDHYLTIPGHYGRIWTLS